MLATAKLNFTVHTELHLIGENIEGRNKNGSNRRLLMDQMGGPR
jgi:hypothetical protein